MTRRSLFGVLAGLLGAAAVAKLPAKAALPVVTAPETLSPTYTNVPSKEACAPPLTIEHLEAALQKLSTDEKARLDAMASGYKFAWDDTERGWHYVNERAS